MPGRGLAAAKPRLPPGARSFRYVPTYLFRSQVDLQIEFDSA
jgi:hypothetical protein